MVLYTFKEWRDETGNPIGTSPTLTINIDRDRTLTAVYEEVPVAEYTLTIATTLGGTTSPIPGTYTYASGTIVPVTAIPSSGYTFDHWILDGVTSTSNPINITMDRNHSLTAYFRIVTPQYTLTIGTTTGGSTSPAPGTYTYPQGSSVSVTAIPNSGYQFDHWILNGATRTENPITVTMNANVSLTAYFVQLPPQQYSLTINTTSGGTTSPSPGTYSYNAGTTVQVTAIPSTGYNFDHWTLDGGTYTSNPLSVLMNQNHSLTASFSEIPPPPPQTYKLTLDATMGGSTDPVEGIHEYTIGSIVTITATPTEGYVFVHWELDGNILAQNPINIVMEKDHTLLAVFSTEAPPPIPWPWFILPLAVGGVVIGYLISRKH